MATLLNQLMKEQTPQRIDESMGQAAKQGMSLAEAQGQVEEMKHKNQDRKNKLQQAKADFHLKHQMRLAKTTDPKKRKLLANHYKKQAEERDYAVNEGIYKAFEDGTLGDALLEVIPSLEEYGPRLYNANEETGRAAISDLLQSLTLAPPEYAEKAKEMGKFLLELGAEERQAKLKAAATKAAKAPDIPELRRKLAKEFKTDKGTQGLVEQVQAADKVLEMLGQESPVADKAVAAALQKMSGDSGRLSDFDLQRWGGSTALISKINQGFTDIMNGKYTDTNRGLYMKMATYYKKQVAHDKYVKALRFAKAQADNDPNLEAQDLLRAMGTVPVELTTGGPNASNEELIAIHSEFAPDVGVHEQTKSGGIELRYPGRNSAEDAIDAKDAGVGSTEGKEEYPTAIEPDAAAKEPATLSAEEIMAKTDFYTHAAKKAIPLESVMQSVINKTGKAMTPEQVKKYNKMLKQYSGNPEDEWVGIMEN